MTPDRALLAAIFALALLHLIMAAALFATRIPAMIAARMSAQASTRPGALDTLPARARNVAANYNNLAEAPTSFYAVALAVLVMGRVDWGFAGLCWAFVALRYTHSVIQATVNRVMARFCVFILSWVVLAIMIGTGLVRVFTRQ